MASSVAQTSFAALLRGHRRAADLTQEQLAERAGLGRRSLQRLEADGSRPYRSTLLALADALALSPEERQTFLDSVPPRPSAANQRSQADVSGLARGVFVGRKREMERLRMAFEEALGGRGRLVMLVGEPGIGKTRTSQELETYARMRGATVLWGRAHETAGAPPYWPWLQIGAQWRADGGEVESLRLPPDVVGELSRIFPVLRQQPNFIATPSGMDPESAQFRLFDAYATLLRAVAERAPLLVVLDDLHWADQPALQLLQHVALETGRSRILIAGNYRDTDITRRSALSETLAALNRAPGFERVVLRGLTREETAEYIRAKAHVEPRREVLDRIYEETEGNAFFLSEVVNLMDEEGTLSKDSVSDIAIPDGVKETLGRRLNRLSNEANELLHVAAVIGREFTYDTLTLLGDQDDDTLVRLVEEGIEAHVIEEMRQPGRYRFTHALMQETLLDELSTTRRGLLHGQVGDALERRYGARAEQSAARLATHFGEAVTLTASYAAKATHYARIAGDQAEAQFAWVPAARHYETVLHLMDEDDWAPRCDLLIAIGICYRNNAHHRDSWRALVEANRLAREHGDAVRMARAVVPVPRWAPVPPDLVVSLGREALDALGQGDLPLRFELLVQLHAQLQMIPGGSDHTWPRNEIEALIQRGSLPDHLVDLWEREVRLPDAWFSGHYEDVRRQVADLTERLPAGGWLTSALTYSIWSYFDTPDLGRAERELHEALETGRKLHLQTHIQNCQIALAALALLRGQLREADAMLEDFEGLHFWRDLVRARVAEVAGDVETARLRLPDDAQAGRFPLFRGVIAAGTARIALNRGDEATAGDALALCRDALEATGLREYRRPMLFGELDAAVRSPLVDDRLAVAAYEELQTLSGLRCFPWTGGNFDLLRAFLALRFGDVEAAEGHFEVTRQWSTRERCPIELGRSLRGLAEIAELRGNLEEVIANLTSAGELFARCGAKLYLDEVIAAKTRLQGIGSEDMESSIATASRQ